MGSEILIRQVVGGREYKQHWSWTPLHHVDQGDKNIHEEPIVLSLMHEWPQATRAAK